jgi:hypothetical protein
MTRRAEDAGRRRVRIAAILVVLLLGAAAADGDATGPTRLLDCLIEGHVPERPGFAEQGGYRFEYQSLRGVTGDDRACTVHRLRNAAGAAPTPVRWTLGALVVVDKTRLPRCGGDDCAWTTFVRYFPGTVDTNLSLLSYGLNADAYRETAETFMTTVGLRDDEAARVAAAVASSVGTEIAGRFATADGTTVALHLIAKSRFAPGPAGEALLVYEVVDLSGGGAWASGDVRVEWDALDALGVASAPAPGGSPPGTAVTRAADALEVVVPARAFVLDERFSLRVFARGDDEPLVVVSMPAYVAVEARP